MNRIYKVIWNEALSCFTAVGEYAKGRGKSSKSSVSSNATINTTSNLSAIKTLRLSAIGIGLIAAGFGMQANAVGTYFAGDDSAPEIYTNPFLHQTVTVQGGETVTGDSNTKNISVTADRRNKSLTIKLDENVDLGADGSLKMGDTLVDNSGIKITASDPLNNVVLGNNGLNNGNNQITGVADGLIALGSKDAINGGQLSSLATTVATNKTKYYSANSIGGDNEDNLGATGPNAIAMGKNAKAIGEQAIAIGSSGSGQDTEALGEQSIAIGANVVSTGASSIAIGGDDLDTASKVTGINELSNSYTNSDLIEDPNNPYGHTESGGAASVAIGVKARSEGNLSTAVGVRSSSSGDASSAFGMGSSATKKGSVALGAGSTTLTDATYQDKLTIGGKDYLYAGATNDKGAQISVGSEGRERQIKHVASGEVSAASTDAINGSQLHATNESVKDLSTTVVANKTHFYSVNSTDSTRGNYNNNGATGIDAMAAGIDAQAVGNRAVAMGTGASATSSETTALGAASQAFAASATAVGFGARADKYGTTAMGVNSRAQGEYSTAVGQQAEATGDDSIAMAKGAKATKKSATAVGVNAKAEGERSVALGEGAQATTLTGTAIGSRTLASAVQSTAVGVGSKATKQWATSMGFSSQANGVSSVALGDRSVVNGKESIAIGKGNTVSGTNSIAIGTGHTIIGNNSGTFGDPNNITGSGSYVIGNDNTVANNNTFVLGNNVETNQDNSIVLGNLSTDRAATTETGVTISGTPYTYAGAAPVGVTSVGFVGGERQIINVAAGAVNATSTDAINGSQLYATNEAVDSNTTTINKGFALKAADGNTVQKPLGQAVEVVGSNDNIDTRVKNGKIEVKLNNDLDLGNNGSVSTGNILGGTQVNRLGIVTGGLLMGGVTTVSGLGVTVTGINPLSNATLTSDGLSMIGGPSITKSNGINAGNKKIVNVDDGIQAKDAVNVSQLSSASAAARTEVAAGTNVAGVPKSTGGNGQDIYTVNADGVTASAGSTAVTVTAGDKDTATNMTDYAVDLSADSKASLVKADSAMQTVITQIDGDEVKTLNKTDNTANFLTGKNIVLTDKNGDIEVATAAVVDFTEVTTGNTLLNTGGVSFLGGSTVSLSSNGLDNGGNRIINVDDGDAPMDAVNVRQLESVKVTANRGWDISAQGNTATASTVEPGESVDFNSKNSNITVSKDNTSNDVSFELNNNLDLGNNGSVEMGSSSPFGLGSTTTLDRSGLTTGNVLSNTTVNGLGVRTGNALFNTTVTGVGVAVSSPLSTTLLSSNGLNIVGGPSVTKSGGINAGNRRVINVDDGIQAKDAVNVSQLNSASAAARTEVAAGTNVAGVAKSTGGNGQDVYTVNADGVTASAGSTAVTVTAGDKDLATNTTDYAVDLSADSKASLVKADSAMQTVVAQIDGNEVKTLNQTDNTANFITGDNIVLTAENDGIKISTAENVIFTSVTTGDTVLNTDGVSFLGGSTVSLSDSGLNNGSNKITNVDNGEADTDAVNVRQLNATNSTVDLGLNFTGDDTAAIVNRKLGQTLTIQGGATELTENNIGVIADEEGNLNVRLAEDVVLGTNGSVRMENTVLNNAGITITDGPKQTVTLSNEGLDNGNNRIIKVGEGIAPTDAVNFAQLTTTNNEIAKGIRIGDGNSANDQQFALGDTINVTGDRNLTTVASATGVQVKLNNQLDLGDEGSIQIGNSIMSNAGFTFVDNGFGRMLSQASQVSLTSRGLDNGGNTITNIGAGTLDSDAVNVGQLKEVAIALDQGWGITAQGDIATMVKQGDALDLNSTDGNIKVSRTSVNNVATTDANARVQAAAIPAGVNDISFDLNPDISLNSVTTGDTTINSDGLTIVGGPSITKSGINAAGNKVTNIQNGEVTVDSQDAINGSQLHAQGSGISSIIGGATVYNAADGTFTNSNIGGTGEGSIDGAIASIRQGTIEINETVQINTTAISTNTSNIATNTTNIATNTTNIATNTSNITTNTTNIQSNTDKIDAGLNFGADSGADINKPVGDDSVLSFTGGNNITTTAEGSSIKFDLNGNINVDSVTTGTTVINSNGISMQGGPSMTAQGINAGSQRITGVADGIEATDAVNYSQLSALDSRLNSNMSDLGYKINEVEDDANAGISAAMAMSALPQAYISGKSLIGGGVSTYNGESAVAVGFSKLSNDGRWVIKVNGTADTQGNVGGAVGAGFHFD